MADSKNKDTADTKVVKNDAGGERRYPTVTEAQKQEIKEREAEHGKQREATVDIEASNLEKYPDDSPAHEGKTTTPSGQGGETPKDRPDHQDMFPKNDIPEDNQSKTSWQEMQESLGKKKK